MIGEVTVRVRNNRNTYAFTLRRNITILCGDSGKGKTTLFDMIADYNRFGKASAVKVSCNKRIIALNGADWIEKIKENTDSVIVVDEDSKFIRSKDFAIAVKNSNCYFLLITRNYLGELPISVDEIYRLEGAKNKHFKNIYNEIEKMYDSPSKSMLPFIPEIVITEDSKSGFQFFESVTGKCGIKCISAQGKSNIYKLLEKYDSKNVAVIADGAAFGTEIRDIAVRQKLHPKKIAIFLPESFEWLILRSGVVNETEWEKVTMPEKYVDSSKYISWERYFTDLLIETTKDMKYKKYSKDKLVDFYLNDRSEQKILENVKGLKF